jgi:nicotinate-nucleotide adenylyltransferase
VSLPRAAIFGGTFDPVHNGHMEAARGVRRLFAIDRVIFVPACVPPHKRTANISSAFHRFAMLALATENDPAFRISTVELESPERPYAVDTVARLQAELGNTWRVFFLMGADSWAELTAWHEWRRLLTMCSPIVVTRPGHDLTATANRDAEISDVRGMNVPEIRAAIENSRMPRTFLTDAAITAVSATVVRAAARAGREEELRTMVPQSVANYIAKHGLYKD